MLLIAAQKCPKCGSLALFPKSEIIIDISDGKKYGPIVMACNDCGYKPESDKEALARFKKYLMENHQVM